MKECNFSIQCFIWKGTRSGRPTRKMGSSVKIMLFVTFDRPVGNSFRLPSLALKFVQSIAGVAASLMLVGVARLSRETAARKSVKITCQSNHLPATLSADEQMN